jgi:hypothetical protein
VLRRARRSTTRHTNSSLEISISAKLHRFVFVFLLVWLALCAVTELFQLRTLLTRPEISLNLRVDPEPHDSEGPRLSAICPFRTGPVAFEFGWKTVRFADGVSETEAQEIVELLKKESP